jgi:hypothetical protein
MFVKIRGVSIGMLEAGQVLFGPMTFMTDSDVRNILQSQAFFPYRYRHPQRALIIFKPVSGDPGGAARKLDAIQQNKNI